MCVWKWRDEKAQQGKSDWLYTSTLVAASKSTGCIKDPVSIGIVNRWRTTCGMLEMLVFCCLVNYTYDLKMPSPFLPHAKDA
ncbi:hypothetical protein AFLA_014159 [Aspergillus flavus NRRL3357]|nr:hypothetical protein AFLA_014159 [Aspergillus flavus NRRL3357]